MRTKYLISAYILQQFKKMSVMLPVEISSAEMYSIMYSLIYIYINTQICDYICTLMK